MCACCGLQSVCGCVADSALPLDHSPHPPAPAGNGPSHVHPEARRLRRTLPAAQHRPALPARASPGLLGLRLVLVWQWQGRRSRHARSAEPPDSLQPPSPPGSSKRLGTGSPSGSSAVPLTSWTTSCRSWRARTPSRPAGPAWRSPTTSTRCSSGGRSTPRSCMEASACGAPGLLACRGNWGFARTAVRLVPPRLPAC